MTGPADPIGAAIGAAAPLSPDQERIKAAWAALELRPPSPRQLRRSRIVTPLRRHPAGGAVDMMRTKMERLCAKQGWRTIMVTSPTAGCGKTTTAVNLAFSHARRPAARIMLLEMDFRRPSLGRMLGLQRSTSIEAALSGDAPPEHGLLRLSENLAVGLAQLARRDAAELLQGATCATYLASLRRVYAPDLMLVDLPPFFAVDDALGFAAHADCALIVAAENQSRLPEVDDCAQQLEAETAVMGLVLTKSAGRGLPAYGYGYGP